MLALDAFSSDAIPLHLLTAEAFQSYARVLAPNGVLMVHITNRHIDLEPVIAAIAAKQGWTARLYYYGPERVPTALYYTKSTWVALTRTPSRMAELTSAAGDAANWRPLHSRPGLHAWTDDFAAVLPVFKL